MSKLSWKDVEKEYERTGGIIRGGDDELDIKPILAGGNSEKRYEKKKKYADGYYNFKFGDEYDEEDTYEFNDDGFIAKKRSVAVEEDDSPFSTNGLPNNNEGYLIEDPLTYAEKVYRICQETGETPAAVIYDSLVGDDDEEIKDINMKFDKDDDEDDLELYELRELAKRNRGNTKRRH